jgi:hypothetical protein
MTQTAQAPEESAGRASGAAPAKGHSRSGPGHTKTNHFDSRRALSRKSSAPAGPYASGGRSLTNRRAATPSGIAPNQTAGGGPRMREASFEAAGQDSLLVEIAFLFAFFLPLPLVFSVN